MKIALHTMFSEFEMRIRDPLYQPKVPLESLQAQLTALHLMQDKSSALVNHAKGFISRTSNINDYTLGLWQEWFTKGEAWEFLQVCSSSSNFSETILDYQLSFNTTEGLSKSRHYQACYKVGEQRCHLQSHDRAIIRIIGDPILQKQGGRLSFKPTDAQCKELEAQIRYAKSILIHTGGAGIAANQCAQIYHPYNFILVGVFYEVPEHVKKVALRYPGVKFPQAVTMINPQILDQSQETQVFNHGCLSVPCNNRCAVISPLRITVAYLDQRMQEKKLTMSGIDAVVLWHELTHIIEGKTYMDVTFSSLPIEDLAVFQGILQKELERRNQENMQHIPEISGPPYQQTAHVTQGMLRLEPRELTKVLPSLAEETLAGLLQQASLQLQQRQQICARLSKSSLFSHGMESTEDENGKLLGLHNAKL